VSGEPSHRAFADHLRFPAGDDEVVIDGITGQVHTLSQVQARVLSGCRGARSLDEHAALAAGFLGLSSPGPEAVRARSVSMGPQAALDPSALRARSVSMGPQAAPDPSALRTRSVSMGPQAAPNPSALRALVETLAVKGLLVNDAELRDRVAGSVGPPRERPSIELLGIPTNGRPALLASHVRSHAAHARAHGRSVTFVVADSSSGEAAAATVEALRSLAAEGISVRCALRDDRARYAKLLAVRAGVDLDLVEYALLGDARFGVDTGANRNTILLDAAGAPLLFSDDDVRPRVTRALDPSGSRSSEAASSGVRFVSGDPNEMGFGEPGSPLVPEDRFEDVDLVALHESMLGADVARALLEPGADSAGASASFFRRLFRRGGRVAITQLGSAGDHGMASSFGLLLLTRGSRARLLASEARFVHAFTQRLAIKRPERAAIADGASCMTMSTALDAREILPPFAPAGRDADGLFGALVRMCVPDAFSGHLPWAIEHAPPEQRASSIEEQRSIAGAVTLNELVRMALTVTFDARDPSAEALFARAGRTLVGLASRPREADAFFREHAARGLARRLAQMDRLAAEQSRTPAFWAASLDGFAASLRAAIVRPTSHLPFDLVAARGPDQARQLLLDHVGRTGQLLEAWPSIFAAARALRAEGERLSRAVASR